MRRFETKTPKNPADPFASSPDGTLGSSPANSCETLLPNQLKFCYPAFSSTQTPRVLLTPHGLRFFSGTRSAGRSAPNNAPDYAFSRTGHGCTFQMSAAYSATVRSLENFPEPATFKMALRAHSSGSAYNARSCSSASRYDFRSARCI